MSYPQLNILLKKNRRTINVLHPMNRAFANGTVSLDSVCVCVFFVFACVLDCFKTFAFYVLCDQLLNQLTSLSFEASLA